MEPKQQIPSSPLPNPPSSLLRDISNFKTPKPQRRLQTNPSSKFDSPCPQFFTASKQTPKSSYSTVRPRPRYSLAAQKLKAVALEQSKSSRKTQTNKEKSLKSLAKSLTVWLNFLFENPRSCGVEVSRFTGEESSDVSSDGVFLGAKRDSVSHGGVDIDREWRGPKRRKDILWVDKGKKGNKFSGSMYSHLKVSLGDVCSLDDLKERMAVYLSQSNCHEILDAMTHVTKNIDEGRLKMKAHCPIVTDVGMKENALKILMSYNPVWLRIGLYIIFGGESLLPNPNIDTSSEKELSFLKTVSEKLFFSHSGLAKAYIYNKLVDGLYRPGYYEKLGNVILKRILLLVLILDRAKSQSSLPICYGIDGLDGGSPLLFTAQATISSSSEVISDFLSPEVMHGVGNLLTQLMIMGYKVSYQQNPLVKYVFKVTNLFNDLQDGVLLCRVIQLLRHDPSILKKVVVPSDDRKKNLVNCEISLKYLKQIGVPLIDEDGTEIITEDIVNGDKELIISLLWNMFVHLQLPLLINNELISDEIIKINGPEVQTLPNASSHLDMLFEWIKAICDNYDLKVESFTSLVDGKAMWCLLDYYFKKEHCDASSNMDPKETNGASIMSASDYVDAVHNFLLSQKLTTLLGNFPEVLQVSDILECKGACSDRGVIILLVFLSSQLVVKRNLRQINFHKLLGHNQNPEIKCIRRDQLIGCHKHEVETYQNENEDNGRNFKAIMAWWKEMAQHNSKANVNPVYTAFLGKQSSDKQREIAATIIQSHFRRLVNYRNYTRIKNAVSSLQAVIRVWVMVKNTSATTKFNTIENQEQSCDGRKLSRSFSRYLIDRHAFIKVKRSVVIIQRAIRHWIVQKHQTDAAIMIQKCIRGHAARSAYVRQSTATIIQACYRSWILRKSFLNQKQAATKIQSHYRGHISRKRFLNKKQAATKIQRYYCGLVIRKNFINQKQAAIIIQSYYRGFLVRKSYLSQKQAATKIQSYCRGWLSRNGFLKKKQAVMKLQRLHRSIKGLRKFKQSKLEIKAAITIQCHTRRWIARRVAYRCKRSIVLIQRFCRGWLTRRGFLLQKEAATRIQSALRSLKCFKEFNSHKKAAIVIQRFVKGWIIRKRLLESDAISGCNHDHTKDGHEFKLYEYSTVKLQRWWRGILLTQSQKRSRSAALIQSNVRGWIARKKAAQSKHRIAVIQSYWKGYIERKHSRGKVADIRLRVQKAAANVDDGMRIINRLIAALSDLKNMKSVSGILHTCATIDMATKYSQKCCEKLVDAGAIDTLLELIRSISRSIVDQEVLRHTLSIFRNLTRYPHLTEALIDTNGSCQIILWEFIRNKEDSYFVAADVLRKICSNKKGVERLRGLMALVKRLNNLVEDLKRKACNEKRNQRIPATKEPMDRRLKEAIQILKLITNG
ncbi:abnormal spindle-like microcephaly-associated protein homolog isoform X1 [Helianthus annuus]|uniref:abnormal spindle-like microcephaly-associated protein homolog isoform X1 n=1 Tax=Helianthus annuus TaxID=4232 RepID=UPI000B8F7A25|nr:abnormal spindle-like microcephaly-associated protein homolog isoform X1 [Helianthus annuus]